MSEIELTADVTKQLLAYSRLRRPDERLAFVGRPLEPSVVLHVAKVERNDDVRRELGRVNADDPALLRLAIEREDTTLTNVIAAHATSAEIHDYIFDFVARGDEFPHRSGPSRSWEPGVGSVRFGFSQIKRDRVDAQRDNPRFISAATRHRDPLVRAAAAQYAERADALAMLSDPSPLSWEQQNVVIERFADDPTVAHSVLRASGGIHSDRVLSRAAILARTATNRNTLERLFEFDASTGVNPAAIVAHRLANDPATVDFLISRLQNLDEIAAATTNENTRSRIRALFIDPSTAFKPNRRDQLGRVLVVQFSEDPEVATAAAELCSTWVCLRMIKATRSTEVLMAFAESQTAQFSSEIHSAVKQATDDIEVLTALENSRLTGQERSGRPTPRSLAQPEAKVEDILESLTSANDDVRAAAQDALRNLSRQHSSANASRPGAARPTPGLSMY